MFFDLENKYRRFYNDVKSTGSPPRYTISDTLTFVYDVNTSSPQYIELMRMNNSKSKELVAFIVDNVPDGNIRIIRRLNGKIDYCFCTIQEDRSISIKNGTEKEQISDLACIYSVCRELAEKETYLGEQSITYRNKRTGKDTPLKIVYISKEKRGRDISPLSNEKIEWKHSWKVCGHWRVFDGIGKNRYGERCVHGKTWVNPCIKGNGELVEKIRLFKKED